MGKKFKSSTNQSPKGQKNAGNGNTVSHTGISIKSKEIRKQKKQEFFSKIQSVAKPETIVESIVTKMKQKTQKILSVENHSNGGKKSKAAKLNFSKIKLDHAEQESKKKRKKAKVENEPKHIADETKAITIHKKSPERKNHKMVDVDTGLNDEELKKPKKNKHTVKEIALVDSMGEKHLVSAASTEIRDDDHYKKLKKNKKHKKHLDVANKESQPCPKPEIKVKHNNHKSTTIEADKDVITSESESEDEQIDVPNDMDEVNRKTFKQHSKPDKDKQTEKNDNRAVGENKEKRFTGPEHSIFIGNLPNTVKKSTMKSMFKQYGQILTIRFRSNDGVTLFKKKDWKQAKALNCYIRFETKQQAEAACAANGQLVEGNRIRVTMHTQKQIGHTASTIFVGNINRKTTDNELYDFFSRVGEIEYVRQIADKGIGFVCFKKGVSIAKALKLNQQLLNGRPLRIVKVDPTKQGQRKNKKGNLVAKAKLSRSGGPASLSANQRNLQHAGQSQKRPPVREFHGAVAKANSDSKHKHKWKKGGSDKKKLLAQKLIAAGARRKM